MPCTNNHQGMPPKDPAFETPGKPKGNAFRTIKANNCKDKGLDKHHSTPLLPQNPGITNWSQWTLIGLGPQEETGKDEVKGNPGETSPEQTMLEPKEVYRVCV